MSREGFLGPASGDVVVLPTGARGISQEGMFIRGAQETLRVPCLLTAVVLWRPRERPSPWEGFKLH